MNAKAMALAGTKIAPTYFRTMTWAEVKARFTDQVKNKACPGQRDQEAQVMHGWNHIKDVVLAGQATLQVVTYQGPAKRFFPEFVLVDGYHRITYWMSLEDDKVLDACPFSLLNLEVHTVEAKTKEEAKLLTDKVARAYNSMASVKKNGDFLSAAVRQAGLSAGSVGYKTGRGSGVVSFLGRVVGDANMPTPALTALAARDLPAHEAMDKVLQLIEASPRLRSLRGRMFNPGVMQALFERFQHLPAANLSTATSEVCTALNNLGKAHVKTTVPMSPVVAALHQLFTELTGVEFIDKVRAVGNREEQYNYIRDYLREQLVIVGVSTVVSIAGPKVVTGAKK